MAGFEGYLTGGLLLFIWIAVFFLVGILGFAAWYITRHYMRYSQYECFIFYKDGFGQLSYKKDKAGIFVDPKTKNKRFFLKKNNVGLSPDNVPVLPGTKNTVFLAQYGLKNFSYVRIKMDDIDKIMFNVGEEDVNWAVNAAEREEKKWRVKDRLLQYMPYISLALVAIIILVMFIYLFKEIPSMLGEMKQILLEAQKLSAMNQGTTVIPS